MDFDNESLLRCFCSEEEEQRIIAWNKENGHARSDIFEFSIFGWKDLPCEMPQRTTHPKCQRPTRSHTWCGRANGLTRYQWLYSTRVDGWFGLLMSFEFGVCRREGVRLRVLCGFVKHRRVHCNCSVISITIPHFSDFLAASMIISSLLIKPRAWRSRQVESAGQWVLQLRRLWNCSSALLWCHLAFGFWYWPAVESDGQTPAWPEH